MKNTIKSILLAAILLPVSYVQAATVIHAGNAFTGTDDKLTGPVSLIIENDTISEIRKGHIKVAKGDTLIDLSESVVLPGLMDMHVHLSSQQSGTSSYLKRFTLNEADYALAAAHYANKTLMAGFTTVRNLGDSYNETVSLRNAINQGMATGPRIYTAAKSLATTGGHADPSNGMAKRIRPDTGPAAGVINGVAEARQAVRQRYQDGADAIKITATGGVLSVAKSGQNPQFMNDELDAVVAKAAKNLPAEDETAPAAATGTSDRDKLIEELRAERDANEKAAAEAAQEAEAAAWLEAKRAAEEADEAGETGEA